MITKKALQTSFGCVTFAYQLQLFGFKQLKISIVNMLLNSSFQGLFAGA